MSEPKLSDLFRACPEGRIDADSGRWIPTVNSEHLKLCIALALRVEALEVEIKEVQYDHRAGPALIDALGATPERKEPTP